ncbi:MAG TPA: sorbosone dehydrogenase family protein [Steroidobacteraceae bacterium]|nr:sorbosone dehydrogenase family protein [Steroidobacteraceae bacterium]
MRTLSFRAALSGALLASALTACHTLMSRGPVPSPPASIGQNPELPTPRKKLLPTMQVAAATGWSSGSQPQAAAGLAVSPFATSLSHPRWLYVLPNGDVLVAETNAPTRPEEGKGIKGKVMKAVQGKAGAGVPTANRIRLLRDADGDGRAETITEFATQLNSPFGMALVGSTLYVANTDAVMAFDYRSGETSVAGPPRKLTNLPGGPRNHHWTKNILASADGRYLYATTGSNSNVGENGLEQEEGRAAIWQIDLKNGEKHLYATGLRNPNGLAWEPSSGELWTAVNERDELGNDLVPDYITSVHEGAFYGWPFSYYGQHVDARVKPQNSTLVAKATPPDYALGAHVAALGLTAAGNANLPSQYRNGMFVGEHGSWNRKPAVGYKVVFVPFSQGKPAGQPLDVLTGFISANGKAQGRPVGLVVARDGSLLVADDVGNTVWRVTAAAQH